MNNKFLIFGIIISVGISVALTGGCVNVNEWPSQVLHRLNLCTTIEPSHPLIRELSAEFDQYFANQKDRLERIKSSDFKKIRTELDYVEMFIKEKIDYTTDISNEAHIAFEHYPSVAQVLDTQKDDCDGRAIVACSLLVHRGYDSYVIINEQHAWVVTNVNGSTEHILRDNYNTLWLLRWNHKQVVLNSSHPVLIVCVLLLLALVVFKLVSKKIARKSSHQDTVRGIVA
ncbi:MAG: hypothetical protein ACFFAU_09900 [Candidatus Hodarchaeota archaeon]